MTKSPELEDGFKKSCAAFNRGALELNKQIKATQEGLQQQKEKNDGHFTELEHIQERLKNITRKLQETGGEQKDCYGLGGSDGGDGDGNGGNMSRQKSRAVMHVSERVDLRPETF